MQRAAASGLLVDPARVPADWHRYWQPLAFVDLDHWPEHAALPALPPFPLVGLGNPAHPLAARLDCIIEAPISVDAMIQQVGRAPHAASIAVHLLRALDTVPRQQALMVESFSYGLLQGSAEHAAWLSARPRPPAPSPPGRVSIARCDAVLRVTLDRASAHNAIDRDMRECLGEAFTMAALDPEIDVVKLRAVGAAFSVGADLTEFGTTRDPAAAHLLRARTLPAAMLGSRAALLDVHIQGACVGAGLELAAFGAYVTAAGGAWFQLPELKMGLIPGAGGCVSLPRRIGRQRAASLILSGRRISAATALRWGLIDAVVDDRP